MSGTIRMFAMFLLLSAASVIAQVPNPSEPHTVSQVVDFWVTNTEQLILPAAEAMPESKYAFAPSSGQFSGVRTFAEQVKHLAAANYQLAAATLGQEPPAGTDHEVHHRIVFEDFPPLLLALSQRLLGAFLLGNVVAGNQDRCRSSVPISLQRPASGHDDSIAVRRPAGSTSG